MEIQLQRYLQRIEVLLEKRLYELVWKTISKAEKYARENENYHYLLIILDWKRKAMLRQPDIPKINQFLKTGYGEEKQVIRMYENQVEYRKLHLQSDAIIKTRFEGADEETIIALKTLVKDPLLQDPQKALSDRALGLYYAILGNILIYFPDSWEQSNQYYQKALNVYEHKPLFQNENTRIFLSLLSGLSTTQILLKKTKELESSMQKAKDFFYSRPKKIQAGNLLHQYMGILINYISYHIEQLNLEEALEQSVSAREFIDRDGDNLIYLVFYANYAIVSFLLEDFHTALRSMNKILGKEKAGVRKDIVNDFRLYNLMVHYELGNEDILPNLSRSARRVFEKTHLLNPVEQAFLDFFERKLMKANTRTEQREAFRSLGKTMSAYILSGKPPYNQKLYAWLLDWVESKAENTSFLEWTRKKRQEPAADSD